ncbi:MAG: metal-dependent transcriptional regulator [Bacteroidota bacterium]
MHKAEENYLKAIYSLTTAGNSEVGTNILAEHLSTKASSVTDMAKRLAEKNLIHYTPYKGFRLSDAGRDIALQIIRKHRLWESFLVEKLSFKWYEVHEIAEQLEHIQSEMLTNRLDEFLGYPKFDPHGDPIPDKNGVVAKLNTIVLSELEIGESAQIMGVKDSSAPFLQYLESQQLVLGTRLSLVERFPFDQSLKLEVNRQDTLTISQLVSKNLVVQRL